jgi:hypothetical protein
MTKARDFAMMVGRSEAINPTRVALLDGNTITVTDSALVSSIIGNVGTAVYDSLGALPISGLTAGQQAFVSANNRLYISNGNGWYNVASVNATPILTISPSGSVTLAIDGSTPTVITLTGTDSDNADASLIYSVESDGSFSNIATLSQDSSVFTITPLAEGSATPGSSTLTFKVSDGISFGSGTTEFSLTFGPDWSSPTESILRRTSPSGNDNFGLSVNLNADATYLIAAAAFSNTACIFTRSGSTWTLQDEISFSNSGSIYEVAISGNGEYAIIAGYSYMGDSQNVNLAGGAWVFTRSGSSWSFQSSLYQDSLINNARFGSSVALNSDGTYAFVGEPYLGADHVYVYTRSGSTWTKQAKLQASNYNASDNFGYSIDINPDATYIIIGAPYEDTGGSNTGSAYIFTRSGSTWTQQAQIQSSDVQVSDQFGCCVAISSDSTYAIVGASSEDGGVGDPASNAGAAYIFTRSGSTWTQQAKLTASDAQASDSFGASVDINYNGTYVVVGTSYEDGGDGDPLNEAGAAYVFERSGSTWTQVKKITASDAQANDYFGGNNNYGRAVSMNSDGSYISVGARGEDGGAGDPIGSAGAVYIYEA